MLMANYGRSISFPIPSNKYSPTVVRRINGRGSTSLPCRFDPFISHLGDEICSLKEWRASQLSSSQQSAAWICDGLVRLERLHVSLLDDLLQHPKARDALYRSPEWTNRLLDDFLRIADAYSSFRTTIVDLKHEHLATQAAIRRKDGTRIASCLRSERKVEKELLKMAAGVRSKAGKWPSVSDTESELVGIVREVVTMTAEVSALVFGAIVGLSSSLSSFSSRAHCMVAPMIRRLGSLNTKDTAKTKTEDMWRRLETMDECLEEVEAISERLLRSLINTRVFLLNVLTPSL